MKHIGTRTGVGVICLLLGALAGMVGAQVTERLGRVTYINTGLVPLSAQERILFSVSLDDVPDAPPARMRLQFLDTTGGIVATQVALVQPGHSTSLQVDGPVAAVRAHAEVFEPTFQLTSRRTAVSTVEVVDVLTGERRWVCAPPDNGQPPNRN